MPPKEILFEEEVVRKLGIIAYQEPTKVADGLSYIWNETNKWDRIAKEMGLSADDAKKKLKLISVRRNAIVHEADMHPLTNIKGPLLRAECNDVTDCLLNCGNAIGKLVI